MFSLSSCTSSALLVSLWKLENFFFNIEVSGSPLICSPLGDRDYTINGLALVLVGRGCGQTLSWSAEASVRMFAKHLNGALLQQTLFSNQCVVIVVRYFFWVLGTELALTENRLHACVRYPLETEEKRDPFYMRYERTEYIRIYGSGWVTFWNVRRKMSNPLFLSFLLSALSAQWKYLKQTLHVKFHNLVFNWSCTRKIGLTSLVKLFWQSNGLLRLLAPEKYYCALVIVLTPNLIQMRLSSVSALFRQQSW